MSAQGGVYWDTLGGVYWELKYSFIYIDLRKKRSKPIAFVLFFSFTASKFYYSLFCIRNMVYNCLTFRIWCLSNFWYFFFLNSLGGHPLSRSILKKNLSSLACDVCQQLVYSNMGSKMTPLLVYGGGSL